MSDPMKQAMVNGYFEAWLIAEGARDDEATFPTRTEAEEWAEQAIEDCEDEGVQAEAYILHHAHPEDDGEDCQCVQWASDHRPWLETASKGKEGGR